MTSTPTPAPYLYADRQHDLDDAVAAMRAAPVVAVDTEADSRHRYPEKLCLVQLSDGERVFLVDTLADLDFGGLCAVLEDPRVEKTLHGADFDVRGINRDLGACAAPCYDTHIAAKFLGLDRLSLSGLLEDVLGVAIPKNQSLQRSDWSKRPLPPDALDYAAADVAHLVALSAAVKERVRALGREAWVAEECERLASVRYVPPDPETAHLAVKGSRDLDPRGLAVLKELCAFREGEARRLNRPPGFVLSAQALVFLAAHPDADLDAVPGLGRKNARRYARGIWRALARGAAAEPYVRPRPAGPPVPRLDREQSARLARLKAWRTARGAELSLDPALLWAMRSLERIAADPAAFDAELDSPDVRRWQRALFAGGLRSAL